MDTRSARAKFDRARLHRGNYLANSMEWINALPPTGTPIDKRSEYEADGSETIIWALGHSTVAVPNDLTTTVADALSNYRAVLDHLAWESVTKAGTPKTPGAVAYPISIDAASFDKEFDRKMPGVSSAIREMVRRQQPHNNGEQFHRHPLWVLHEWNRTDKHRTLPIVVMAPTKLTMESQPTEVNFVVSGSDVRTQIEYMVPGMDLLRVHGRRKDSTKDHGVKVLVSGEMTLGHESGPVIEAVLDLIDGAVNDALRGFELLA